MIAAVHCCVNGPVSVHKLTKFPTIEKETSIDKLIGLRTSNNSWKGVCLMVAKMIKPGLECNTTKKNGGYWPIIDWYTQEEKDKMKTRPNF